MGKNIVLIGFMGTGKSAVARRLAKLTHRPSFDLDAVIEQEQGATISEIFAQMGEVSFRKIETEVIARFSERCGVIISTGGGAPTIEENVALLKRNGIVVRLVASPNTVLGRIRSFESRPVLASAEDPKLKIEELMKTREACYASAADISVETDGKSVHEIAAAILKAVEQSDCLG